MKFSYIKTMCPTAKKRVTLVHWNRDEGVTRAGILRRLGYEIRLEVPEGPPFFKRLQADPPDAVVIDLSRLPSQGRDIGLAIRNRKATRGLPLVFAAGDPTKVDKIRELIPDLAAAADWDSIGKALLQALRNPPRDPVKPASVLAGYAGAPLVKKLGIRPGSTLSLIGAPDGFEASLNPLPNGVKIIRKSGLERDLTIWFVGSEKEMKDGLIMVLAASGKGRLWIAWPKKGSGLRSELTQQKVRNAGLAAGWVDYKICSINAVWSGLLFTKRKPKKMGGTG
jgi:hypothetical protein